MNCNRPIELGHDGLSFIIEHYSQLINNTSQYLLEYISISEMQSNFDVAATAVTTVCLLVAYLAFIMVFCKQYSYLKTDTLALQIFTVRAALFPSLYATILYVSFLVPYSFGAFQVFITIFEGYSLFLFLSMIVQNFGTVDATTDQMTKAGREPFCWCFCYPKNKPNYFWIVYRSLIHLMTTRVVLILIATVVAYMGIQKISLIFTALAFIQLVYGFVSLIALCKYSYISDAHVQCSGVVFFFFFFNIYINRILIYLLFLYYIQTS